MRSAIPEFRAPEMRPLEDFMPSSIGLKRAREPEVDETKIGTPVQEKLASVLRDAFQGKDSVDLDSLHHQFEKASSIPPDIRQVKIDPATRIITSDGKLIGKLPKTLQVVGDQIKYVPRTFAPGVKGNLAASNAERTGLLAGVPPTAPGGQTHTPILYAQKPVPPKPGDVQTVVTPKPTQAPVSQSQAKPAAKPRAQPQEETTPSYARSTISSRAKAGASPDETESDIQARMGQIVNTTARMQATKVADDAQNHPAAVMSLGTVEAAKKAQQDSQQQDQEHAGAETTSKELRDDLTGKVGKPGRGETPGKR